MSYKGESLSTDADRPSHATGAGRCPREYWYSQNSDVFRSIRADFIWQMVRRIVQFINGHCSMSGEPIRVSRQLLSKARACVSDIASLSQKIPFFPVERVMDLGPVAFARVSTSSRIGWAAIFLKAYALVARRHPVLRSWYVSGFMSHVATCSASVATLAVNRMENGEDRLWFARLEQPDQKSLLEIQAFVTQCTTRPTEELFKRQLQLEMLPRMLRRFILRWNMNSFSEKRATRIGTFSLSTLAGFNATNRLHPTICTTSLSYAPLDSDKRCIVTLLADHRILDGVLSARVLQELEEILCRDVVSELQCLSPEGDNTSTIRESP